MADFRQRAPEVQARLIDERDYRNVRATRGNPLVAGAEEFVGGLNNVGAALRNEQILANQARVAQRQTLEDQALDTAAGVVARQAFEEGDRLRAEAELNESEIAALRDAGAAANRIKLLQDQGRSGRARAQLLVEFGRRITENPQLGGELAEAFQTVTGSSLGATTRSALVDSEAFERSQQQAYVDRVNAARTEYGFPMGTPDWEVLQYDSEYKAQQRRYEEMKEAHQAIMNGRELDVLQQRRLFESTLPEMQVTTQMAAAESLNAIKNRIDPNTSSPEEISAALLEIDQVYTDSVAGLIGNFGMLGLTQADIDSQMPHLALARDYAKGYVNGTLEKEALDGQVELLRSREVRDLHRRPGFTTHLAALEALNEVSGATNFMPEAMKSSIGRAAKDTILQLVNIATGEQVKDIFGTGLNPNEGIGATGTRPNQTTRQVEVPVAGQNRIDKALGFIGMTLNNMPEDSKAREFAVSTFSRLSDTMAKDADGLPPAVYKDFANWLSTDEGWDVYNSEDIISDPMMHRNFRIGLNNYMQRTAEGLARDLRGEINERIRLSGNPSLSNVLSFAGITEALESYGNRERAFVYDVVDYQVSSEGRLTFIPKPEYADSRGVRDQVAKLNRKYSDHLTAEGRAFTRLVGSENFRAGFEQLFTLGELPTLAGTNLRSIFEILRQDNPDLTMEQVEAAYNDMTGQR